MSYRSIGRLHFLVLSASLAAASVAGAVELRFAHGSSEAHFVNVAAKAMAEQLDSETQSGITMSVFPNEQLGGGPEIIEQVTLGAEIMTVANSGDLAEFVPDIGVIQFPFLYSSYAEAEPLLKSELFSGWKQELAEQHNVRLLCLFNFGVRDLFTVNAPVRTPADMKGMKVRVQPVELYLELVKKSFGAVPTPLPYSELYSALSQGVVDAAESPPVAILDQKFNEVSKYLTLTNHVLDLASIIMSEEVWAKLSDAEQKALQASADLACSNMTSESEASYEAAVDELAASGMEVIRDPDLAAFREGAAEIEAAFPEWSPGLLANVKKAIATQ
ncbi:TRAP transporter substrate-binding protein [Pseudorhizobium flavum]|uniref:TRAP transporter substrate-binding protein n=1 Tax=Pseudorhizobium flavum TaxID=1335061 RepID=UPI00376FF7ED